MSEPREVMTSLHEADKMEDGTYRFIPCLVTENEAGYRPMRGADSLAAPWYWGNTNDECQARCDEWNRETYRIEPEEALEIVASSMRAQNGLFARR